jgi:Xaa-Pro aminopeptidase
MRMRATNIGLVFLLVVAAVGPSVRTQAPVFSHAFPPEEFAARRAVVLERIGDGLAVLQGATEVPAYKPFRQNAQFYYLTGVEVPRAILLLDGRTKSATLFVPPRNARLERSEGPVLVPGDEAERLTGIARVRPRQEFAEAYRQAAVGARVVYAPKRAESLGAATPQAAAAHAAATTADPWDGRPSREQAFIAKLKAVSPEIEINDLDPVVDAMRLIKSPREIAAIREATRQAGVAIMEVMRAARPGLREHELEAIADYVFKKHGSQGIAYFALVATGKNAYYPHYHGGRAVLAPQDLVLFDYAPDYHYYTSDVTRMFPAGGRFTPVQRELYTVYQRMYQALMESIKPNVAPRDIIREAVQKMDRIVSTFGFSDETHRRAAVEFVERYRRSVRNSLGHMVGMEVHDVSPSYDVLQPGMVFTIEPALTLEEDRVYIRLEDVILITETGYENLSSFVPVDVAAIEKLMGEASPFEAPATQSSAAVP